MIKEKCLEWCNFNHITKLVIAKIASLFHNCASDLTHRVKILRNNRKVRTIFCSIWFATNLRTLGLLALSIFGVGNKVGSVLLRNHESTSHKHPILEHHCTAARIDRILIFVSRVEWGFDHFESFESWPWSLDRWAQMANKRILSCARLYLDSYSSY